MTSDPPLLAPTAPDLALAAAAGVPHPRPFAARLRIAESARSPVIDHVSNVEYVRWLDRVAEAAAAHAGWGRERLLSAGLVWFVARHEIDYLAECQVGEEIVLFTWVRDVKRMKSWRETVAVRPAARRLVMRASTLWVLVDLDNHRPRRVPLDMAADLDPLEALRPEALR